MNLSRICANAIARRVAYVLVAIALGWLGIRDAQAQDVSRCFSTASVDRNDPNIRCATRQDAYNAIILIRDFWHTADQAIYPKQQPTHNAGSLPSYSVVARANANLTITRRYLLECPTGYFWDEANKSCGVPCDDEAPLSGVSAPGDSGYFCSNNCRFQCSAAISVLLTIDGVQRTVCPGTWTTSGGQTCSAGDPAPIPEVADTDGDGVSDGNDAAPNNPGAGSNQPQDGSSACGGEGQPECAPDGSNAGSGKGNTSGGGGSCSSPPVSTGDAILAQIAFQTWATRCAIEGNANQGGGTGSDPGNGGEEGQPDWTKGDMPPVASDDTDYPAEQTRFGLGVSPDLLDEENIFGNASCPNFSITIWSQTVSTADFDGWCNLVVILRGLILIFGAFSALQILMGRGFV